MDDRILKWDREILGDPDQAGRVEWLETNGLGGYAMSTIIGLNTRRYHGLLVAGLKPPVDRYLFLSKLEDTLDVGAKRFELSCNRYPGVLDPKGHLLQESFMVEPFPVFRYRAGGALVEKTVALVHGRNVLIIRYRIADAPIFTLRVRPLLAFRDYHALTKENRNLDGTAAIFQGGVSFRPYTGLPPLILRFSGGRFREEGYWVRNMEYAEELARGFDGREDLYSPGEILWEGTGGGTFTLMAVLDPAEQGEPGALLEGETRRREEIARGAAVAGGDALVRRLGTAADAFIVARGKSRRSVIAGYPWFTDWGRDTMISLPGLTLTTRRFNVAREILQAYAEHLDRGMIPNRFPDDGRAPEYATADATLWYVHALECYRRASGDIELVKTLYPALTEVVKWHIKGTRFGIRMDPADHLLRISAPGVGLTWMDARIGDRAVTPRAGKPVEINALWYRVLAVMAWWTRHLGSRINPYVDLARGVRESFDRRFWFEAGGYLYDVVDGENGDDVAVRPNQLFALSLEDDLVPQPHGLRILERIRRELLTPYGIRTLSPKDPSYRGSYSGGPESRDGAYHQGTVWPWLLGSYADAMLNVEGRTPESVANVRGLLEPFHHHLFSAAAGFVSEIFDGDPPHLPRGCPAQAWSVAELLRISATVRQS